MMTTICNITKEIKHVAQGGGNSGETRGVGPLWLKAAFDSSYHGQCFFSRGFSTTAHRLRSLICAKSDVKLKETKNTDYDQHSSTPRRIIHN